MISQEQANHLAQEWITAWNAHNLDAIMPHYADDVEFFSPFIVRLLDDPSGSIRGKAALREYFTKGLTRYPDLTFYLHKVLTGVNSVTLYYESINSLQAAEVMELNDAGVVVRVLAHYAPKTDK
jgi:hypothetical protein